MSLLNLYVISFLFVGEVTHRGLSASSFIWHEISCLRPPGAYDVGERENGIHRANKPKVPPWNTAPDR